MPDEVSWARASASSPSARSPASLSFRYQHAKISTRHPLACFLCLLIFRFLFGTAEGQWVASYQSLETLEKWLGQTLSHDMGSRCSNRSDQECVTFGKSMCIRFCRNEGMKRMARTIEPRLGPKQNIAKKKRIAGSQPPPLA